MHRQRTRQKRRSRQLLARRLPLLKVPRSQFFCIFLFYIFREETQLLRISTCSDMAAHKPDAVDGVVARLDEGLQQCRTVG